ncbi:MAG: phospholipase D-like domain-containing protein [Methanoregula sp.]|nr:phospholipase D-like domain-containing protein [Methanoregula sp.]
MAKFLNATGTTAAIVDLIKNSKEFLFIISPYIKMTTQNKNYLQVLSSKNIDFFLIFRSDSKLDPEDEKFLIKNRNTQIFTCDNLHAKCYLNEQKGIISSLNFYEHSQANNWEMGVLFDKNEDSILYEDAFNELKFILDSSKSKSVITQSKQPIKSRFIPEKKGLMGKILDATLGPQVGYCIRCGKEMELNPNRPLCSHCYGIWSKHANLSYKEIYCHHCGKERQTSYEKPLCYDCFTEKYQYL